MNGMMIDDLVDTGNIVDKAVTAGKLSAALQDLLPNIVHTGVNDADGTGSMELRVHDANNNFITGRFLMRIWIADAEYSEPDAQTGFGAVIGELMREIEANADYEIITGNDGDVTMDINTATDRTVYVMAEIDGRIYTGSIAITGN